MLITWHLSFIYSFSLGLIHSVFTELLWTSHALGLQTPQWRNLMNSSCVGRLHSKWDIEIQTTDQIDYRTPSDGDEFYEESKGDIPHLFYPFLCRWTSRLLSCPGYCKQCSNEHWGASVFSESWFSLGLCPQVGLLGHMVALFLVF